MKEGMLGDKCPACGAPKTSFEPYIDPMAKPRRRILKFQLHPIAVHFPIAFTVATFVFSMAILFLSGDGQKMVLGATKVLVLFIPVLVVIAFVAGWVDGKVRFRKIRNSQILKRKILYGILLFVAALAQVFVVWIGMFDTAGVTIGAILLSGAAVVLVFLLGLLGTSIVNSAFPGK